MSIQNLQNLQSLQGQFQTPQSWGGSIVAPQINEPTVTGRLQQLMDSMALAEQRMSNLRGHLFGDGESGMNQPQPTTIREIVDSLGTRLASLCGELATVNQRMGCPPDPAPINNQLR